MTTGAAWEDRAQCAIEGAPPGWFFATEGTPDFTRAKALCDRCAVRAQCHAAGANEFGLWGGQVSVKATGRLTVKPPAGTRPNRGHRANGAELGLVRRPAS